MLSYLRIICNVECRIQTVHCRFKLSTVKSNRLPSSQPAYCLVQAVHSRVWTSYHRIQGSILSYSGLQTVGFKQSTIVFRGYIYCRLQTFYCRVWTAHFLVQYIYDYVQISTVGFRLSIVCLKFSTVFMLSTVVFRHDTVGFKLCTVVFK